MICDDDDQEQEKSLQIKQDDRFFSRLMSKETSMANSSSIRVPYYGGGSVSVPFMWESQPGTPKHTLFSDQTTLPPLTPPPSYCSYSKSNSKPNRFSNILPLRSFVSSKKPHSPSFSFSSSSSSSSSSWSSSSYSISYSMVKGKNQGTIHSNLPSPSRSPVSIIKDQKVKHKSSNGFRGGCYQFGNMKNALLAVVGHGSK
ncbi:Alkylated DNA repair protein [Quillaja saponaria]|uniref:Alkylated DNA repair protein n=1 Tax=Quillaja saponaria TaxID=32244 RepID=A0AAD7LM50_QUISA|nr:Alkylated DNA repair protein [Quillaja saponaria]